GKMKAAGCKRVAFGVETGDEDILVSIDKRIDHATIRQAERDRKSTRLNSSHEWISYAVFCLKKKKETQTGTGTCGASEDRVARTLPRADVFPIRRGEHHRDVDEYAMHALQTRQHYSINGDAR